MSALDLDLFGDLGARARSLVSPVTLRGYMAAVMGRRTQRVVYGAHAGPLPMPVGVPVELASNVTKDRVLLVTVFFQVASPVRVTSSVSAGSSSFVSPQVLNVPFPFLLFPEDALFGTAALIANAAVVARETY